MANKQYPVPFASAPSSGGGGGSGTVTSVTFTGDGVSSSATPSAAVTTSGTLTATPATQSGNVVIASPANGSSGTLSARALVPADLSGVGVVSGLGYETLPWGSGALMANPAAVGAMDGSANRCRFAIFSLMETLKMTTLSVNVTTTASTQKIFIGIYDAANTTLLGQWTFTLGAGTGVLSATKVGGGSLTLSPGPYMFVWASDSTSPVVTGFSPAAGSGNIFGSLMNKNATRIGQGAAGSPVSAGTMPPNLGTLVASAAINVPAVFVEP